jgi:mono/diheme cytochrome c family protein
LTTKEVGALTAFLLDKSKGTVPEPGHKGDAQRGAKRFREAGCAACHAVKSGEPPAEPNLPAPAATALSKGCLADEAKRGKAPDFGLSAQQRQALRAFLQTDGSSLTRETAAEFSLRQVEALQCTACHRRDGASSRLAVVVQEEGSGQLPEGLPSLTWAGEKLRPEWTVKLLLGQHDHRARPWLKARMPAFPARADLLAVGLSHEHGFGEREDPRLPPDPKLAEVGRKLLPMQGGFNCVLCHGVGKEAATAFEAPGINLLDAALRLRHEYYQRWMLDPPRVDITTRMPKFAPDGKTTPLTEVLGGDARRQAEAIWHHLQTLPRNAGK